MAERRDGKEERKEPGFEDALGRLEKIVEEMESGSLPLEAMIGRFEEGQKLIGRCTRTLEEVERRIEILVKKGNTVKAEPFEADSGPGAGEGPVQTADGDELF